MPYAIDLFCGAGGMSEGLIQAGFHILFSSDINEDVKKTYMNRHEQLGLLQGINTHYHMGDIKDLTGELIWDSIRKLKKFEGTDLPSEIDAIFGGPPCQGFSRAGRRNFDDPRNLLFREYIRVISEIKPKYVVMENVVGFMDTKLKDFIGVTGKKYKGEIVAPEILRNEFELIGFSTLEPQILDAADYGVPQRRNRAIFMAYRSDLKPPQYPEAIVDEKDSITLQDAISDLIRDPYIKKEVTQNKLTQFQKDSINGRTPDINGNVIHSNEIVVNNEVSNHTELIKERFSLFLEGEDGNQLRNRIKNEGIDLKGKDSLLAHCSQALEMDIKKVVEVYKTGNVSDRMLDVLLTKKNIRSRLDRTKASATVLTIADDYISPFEARSFTVRELARLQSFDDSFEFLGKRTTGGLRRRVEVPQYTQVGNAVPPLLARAIAKEIINVLKAED